MAMYAVGASSDPGPRQSRNEDSIFAAWGISDDPTSSLSSGLFIVADGMGGYADGQDASSGAIQAMVDYILPKIARSNDLQPEACTALLAEAVQLANKAVLQQNIDLHKIEGTDIDVGVLATITAAMIVGSTAYVANVGNCRTYLYQTKEGLKQITTDHTIIARLVEEGTLPPEAVYTHPQRNQMYRALFDQAQAEVDIFTVPLQRGDALLLCSAGLWDTVRAPRIEDILSHALSSPARAAKTLIQAALDAGSRGNISAIVVSVLETAAQPLTAGVQFFANPARIHMPHI